MSILAQNGQNRGVFMTILTIILLAGMFSISGLAVWADVPIFARTAAWRQRTKVSKKK